MEKVKNLLYIMMHYMPHMLYQIMPVYIGFTLGYIYSDASIDNGARIIITILLFVAYLMLVFINYDFQSRIKIESIYKSEGYNEYDINAIKDYYFKKKILLIPIAMILITIASLLSFL